MFEIWTLRQGKWSWYCIGIELWSDVIVMMREIDVEFDQLTVVTRPEDRPGEVF